jgi:glycosyltransferase involved in cell wall biosynthesis
MAKKILLIAHDFPPRRTSGVYRPLALVRHLGAVGWAATVLTIADEGAETRDTHLLERMPPEVRVVRTPTLRVNAWESFAARTFRFAGKDRSSSAAGLKAGSASPAEPSRLRQFFAWLASLVRLGLYFPDEFVGWVPWGLPAALDLCFRERFDVVYTTSPPRSTPLIGLFVKLLLGVTWIAESRDPWLVPMDVHGAPARARHVFLAGVRERLARWTDSLIVRKADLLVSVTRGYADHLRGRYPSAREKVVCVSNGFEEEDFASRGNGDAGVRDADRLCLSHIGTIYFRGTGRFFPALAELVRERPEIKNRLRINIIGYPDEEALKYAEDETLREMICLRRFVQHDEALRIMAASHGLLVFYANSFWSRFCVPGKLYEYLRSGRPILAVTYPGEVQELVEGAQAGWVVHPDDVPGIKRALNALLGAGSASSSMPSSRPEYVAQFRYDRLTAQLATVLERVSRHA